MKGKLILPQIPLFTRFVINKILPFRGASYHQKGTKIIRSLYGNLYIAVGNCKSVEEANIIANQLNEASTCED